MSGRLRLGILALTLLLVAAPALATTTRPKQVNCPICEKEITVLTVSSSNSFGGADYDLCGHARGDSPRSYSVWTCPHCLWSRYGGKFEEPPQAALAARVKAELKSPLPIAPDAGQRDIPAWLKYRLAATILEWEGTDADAMAQHRMAGAWATRCEGRRALRPFWNDEEWKARGNALSETVWKEVEAKVTEKPGELFYRCRLDLAVADRHLESAVVEGTLPGDAIAHRLLAASLLRFRGENDRVLAALEPLAETEDLPAAVREARAAFLASVDREREFQRGFVTSFRASVKKREGEPAQVAAGTYVLGETLRRLGRTEEAVEAIRAALSAEGGPAWLTPAATEALKRLGVEGPSEEELAEVRKRRLAGAIARLSDPATARDARDELSALRLPGATPGIVDALDSEHAEVRSQAALALGYQPEPGDAAIDRLGRVLLEDEEQDPRWRAAVSLARLAPERSRETLEKAILKEEDEWVLRCLIEGLGLTGDERSMKSLLKCFFVEDREVARALTRIANREVSRDYNTREELLEWWEKNLPGKRDDWVKAGFRAIGVEFEGEPGRKDVPKLLDLLSHEHYWIRTNAARLLRRVSGRSFPIAGLADEADHPRAQEERRAEIRVWRDWWEAEK